MLNLIPPSRIAVLSWQTGLSNSEKLLAMPCRDTQDGQIIVDLEQEMAGHFNIFAKKTPWTETKG